MPTYRIPVSVTARGFVEIVAEDPVLALAWAKDPLGYENFDISQAEQVEWEPCGEPEEER